MPGLHGSDGGVAVGWHVNLGNHLDMTLSGVSQDVSGGRKGGGGYIVCGVVLYSSTTTNYHTCDVVYSRQLRMLKKMVLHNLQEDFFKLS